MKPVSTFLKAFFAVGLVPVAMALSGCPDDNTTEPTNTASGAKGKLYVTNSGRVFSYDVTTGAEKNITDGRQPEVTPEGTIIVVAGAGSNLEEHNTNGTTRVIVDQDGNSPFEVRYNDEFNDPQLSPDGTMIAYQGRDLIVYVVSRATGALLHTLTPPASGEYRRPSWTPDGRLVVGGSIFNNAQSGLYISDNAFTKFDRFDPNLGKPSLPIVSPDGTKVAFILNDQLNVINIDGTGKMEITTTGLNKATKPAWSPDGKWIALYGTLITRQTLLLYSMEKNTFTDIGTLNPNFIGSSTDFNGQIDWKY